MEKQVSMKRLPLETVRKRKGLSAHRLAQEAHVSIATVRAIELGTLKRAPRYGTMNAIAQVLAVDPRDIDWPGNPYALDN